MKKKDLLTYLDEIIEKQVTDYDVALDWDTKNHTIEIVVRLFAENKAQFEIDDAEGIVSQEPIIEFEDGVLLFNPQKSVFDERNYLAVIPYEGKKGLAKSVADSLVEYLNEVLAQGQSDLLDFLDEDDDEAVFELHWDNQQLAELVEVKQQNEAVEAVANILMEAGASGVAIEDSLDVEHFQSDQYGEILDKNDFTSLKEGALVMAYFPETTFLPEILPFIKDRITQLPEFGLAIGKNKVTVSEVEESNWATAWKKYYHPVRITRMLTVAPSWENYQTEDPLEKIITLDPGMAFGTGTHPTTSLTLTALETVLRGGETLLDVGTGSGVLSIAAKYLGAKDVYAFDLDEVAVRSAKENMDMNEIAKDVHVSANDLLTGIEIESDVIVANILADIILLMIPDAWRLLKQTGTLIVSGIIEEKKQMVLDAMLEQGFIVDQIFQQKDWYAIILKKPEVE
ncbi:TPA: 50S ribosomal protein L11 methyltransferase [Enterococcus faecium]|nr:50S ribosomal protein L11 methyltransferase [Enterococcus faecium]